MQRSSSSRLFSAALVVLVIACTASASTAAAPPQFTCGDVLQPGSISATDALATLQSAVALRTCEPCACDADGSRKVTASDALLILKKAVGQPVTLACPFCCAACACTPQTITLTLADVAPCEGCIPRIPASNIDIDGITISFATDFEGSVELDAVGECVWQTDLVDAMLLKTYYHSGDTTCSGPVSSSSGPGAVTLQVVRDGDNWEVRAGTYVAALGWGDVARASAESATCEIGASAPSQNEVCHLSGNGPTDYDTHAIGGSATIAIADPKPVCTLDAAE